MNLRKYPLLVAGRLAARRPTPLGRLPLRAVEGLARLDIRLLRGETPAGHAATILSAGRANGIDWFAQRLFRQPPTVEPRPALSLFQLHRLLHGGFGDADFVVASVDRTLGPIFAGRDCVRAPNWVKLELRVPTSPDPFVPPCRNLLRSLRTAAKAGLTGRCVHDAASVREFHRELHAPSTLSRYGPTAFVRPVESLEWAARRGGLIQILHGSTVVGGLAFDREGDTLTSLALGQLPTADDHLRPGVGALSYFHLIETARQLGCSTVNFGGCRPALEDGVLVFKRKWGMSVEDNAACHTDLLVHWSTVTPAVEEFFTHTSLIVRHATGFAALANSDDDHWRQFAAPGVDARLRVVPGATFARSLAAAPVPA